MAGCEFFDVKYDGAHFSGAFMGVSLWKVSYLIDGSVEMTKNVFIKAKTANMLKRFFSEVLESPEMVGSRRQFTDTFSYRTVDNLHVKEYKSQEMMWKNPLAQEYTPVFIGSYENEKRDEYVTFYEQIPLKDLKESSIELGHFTPEEIDAALRGISELHCCFYTRDKDIQEALDSWSDHVPSLQELRKDTDVTRRFFQFIRRLYPEIVDQSTCDVFDHCLSTIAEWWPVLDRCRKALIQDDCTPRNMCLRRDPDTGLRTNILLYDWEASRIGAPTSDIVQFLAGTIPFNEVAPERVLRHSEVCRLTLNKQLEKDGLPVMTSKHYLELVSASACDYLIHRGIMLLFFWRKTGSTCDIHRRTFLSAVKLVTTLREMISTDKIGG